MGVAGWASARTRRSFIVFCAMGLGFNRGLNHNGHECYQLLALCVHGAMGTTLNLVPARASRAFARHIHSGCTSGRTSQASSALVSYAASRRLVRDKARASVSKSAEGCLLSPMCEIVPIGGKLSRPSSSCFGRSAAHGWGRVSKGGKGRIPCHPEDPRKQGRLRQPWNTSRRGVM